MGSLNYAALLLIVGTLFALLLLIVGGVLLLARRGKRRPCCGKCGYAVAGLQSMTCPECGSDLRQVGITGGVR